MRQTTREGTQAMTGTAGRRKTRPTKRQPHPTTGKVRQGRQARQTTSSPSRLSSTAARLLALLVATALTTLAVMLIATRIMFATAAEAPVTIRLSQPAVDMFVVPGVSEDSVVKVIVDTVAEAEDDGSVPVDAALSMRLEDADGGKIAEIRMTVRAMGDDPLPRYVSGSVNIPVSRYEDVATIVVFPGGEGTAVELDCPDLGEEMAAAVAEAKETLSRRMSEDVQDAVDAEADTEAESADAGEAVDAAEEGAADVAEPEAISWEDEVAAVMVWHDSDDIERADLRISTDAEIEGWARRIDAYLDGSPLAGYGHLFAELAAEYQVDPRLSPAISTMESTKGTYCVASHNAWGWGGPGNWASWDSWESAIEGHVSGLARGGYASMGAAECARYCDWSYWDGDPSLCLKNEVLKV